VRCCRVALLLPSFSTRPAPPFLFARSRHQIDHPFRVLKSVD
jgi:hypothetical protein